MAVIPGFMGLGDEDVVAGTEPNAGGGFEDKFTCKGRGEARNFGGGDFPADAVLGREPAEPSRGWRPVGDDEAAADFNSGDFVAAGGELEVDRFYGLLE